VGAHEPHLKACAQRLRVLVCRAGDSTPSQRATLERLRGGVGAARWPPGVDAAPGLSRGRPRAAPEQAGRAGTHPLAALDVLDGYQLTRLLVAL